MLATTDIRPGDLAWGTGLALAIFAGTVLALRQVDAGTPSPSPEVVRIRAVSAAEVSHPLPTVSPAPAAAPGSRAAKRSSASSRPSRPSSPRRRAAQLPTLEGKVAEPEPEPELGERDPDAPSLPSLAAADTDATQAEPEAPAGEDALAELAISSYRGRLTRFIAARFEVHGTGLPTSVLVGLRGRAQITLDENRTIVDYTYTPTGNEPFDAAALSTLDALRGEVVPPPPEDYPGALQQVISVTFVCKASTCD